MEWDLINTSPAYEQKSQLHYLIFNLSTPGFMGLKRHPKKLGRKKTRQGDTRNILPYGFSSSRP